MNNAKEKAAMPASTAAHPPEKEDLYITPTLYQENADLSSARPEDQAEVESNDRPGYYAIIPADVRYDDRLPANAKLLYGEISALVGKDGFCFAGNGYFAKLYQLSERTITTLLSKLQDCKYIDMHLERDGSTGQILERRIFLKASSTGEHPIEENFYTPGKSFREGIEKNFRDTNTSITDIKKEKVKKEKTTRRKKAPSVTDFDPLPLFVDWLRNGFPDRPPAEKNAVYLAFVRFCEERAETVGCPVPSKRALTAIQNNLVKHSEGNLRTMVDLLDTATANGWKTVYPPMGSKSRNAQPQKMERTDEIWL